MEQIRNAHIDAFILSGKFEIALEWGMDQLTDYLNEFQLLAAGAPYASLGISQRREASFPVICNAAGMQRTIVRDPERLANAAYVPQGSFALLKLQGVMRSQDGASSQGINSVVDNIHAANENPNIDGILIQVNTGGGESMAGSMVQDAIASSQKAIVGHVTFMASAGVRALLPADELIAASKSAEVGSIGTYITLQKRFADWYNANYEDVYAKKSDKKNTPVRALLQGDKSHLQDLVDQSNEYFLKEVQTYRALKGDVKETLSGAMFYANDAKQRGLIDGIGNCQYALHRLQANVQRRKKMMQ